MTREPLVDRLLRLRIMAETFLNYPRGRLRARTLSARNRRSSSSVTGHAPLIVSLTSYGGRIDTVHLTIESLAGGSVRPRRLILWLDDAERFATLTPGLRRLQERGLEIRLTENLGPYTKFFPTLAELDDDDLLVTADDDLLYPATWLARLVEAQSTEPDLVHCYRARDIVVEDGTLAPYARWRLSLSTTASFHRFATGVSGVIYPRTVIEALRAAGDAFRQTAPRADDIWLHVMSVTAGARIRQMSRSPRHFPLVPRSQKVTLYSSNLTQGANDPQIAATYPPEVIARIAADAQSEERR